MVKIPGMLVLKTGRLLAPKLQQLLLLLWRSPSQALEARKPHLTQLYMSTLASSFPDVISGIHVSATSCTLQEEYALRHKGDLLNWRPRVVSVVYTCET